VVDATVPKKDGTIQFSNFYDDIDFMAAMFYSNLLDSLYIYEIAAYLTNKTSDDSLAKIIANGGDDNNNKKLFENYLNAHGIKFLDPKRYLTAKIFYYMLNNKIDFKEGIGFVDYNVSEPKYAGGDDIGIDRILSKYYAIDEGLVPEKKDIETFKKLILEEMQQYVHDNLVEFPK
jgi:hypothetical protein